MEPGIIHVRIYKERFTRRPVAAETGQLSLGTIHDEDGFGMGHLPISDGEFGLWEPVIVAKEAVSSDELEGYELWKDSRGGVWG